MQAEMQLDWATGWYLPHEAVVVVRLDLARVDDFTGEWSVARGPRDDRVTAAEHSVVNRTTERLLAQFQT